MPFGAQRCQVLLVNDRLATPFAARLVQRDMAVLAVRIALVHHKLAPAVAHCAVLVLDCVAQWVMPSGIARQLWVEERVAAVGAEEVRVMVAALLRLPAAFPVAAAAHEFEIVDRNVALINDWCPAVEASLREQLVVVKVAVGAPLVLVERDMLQVLPTVVADKAVGMEGV